MSKMFYIQKYINWHSMLLVICSMLFSTTNFVSSSRKVWRRVEALIAREAILPCEVGRIEDGDMIYVVLWYLNGRKEPIYSYDNRPYALQKGAERHVLQSSSLDGRVTFLADPIPALYIKPVMRKDQANYTCRVDFRIANSHATYLSLQVVVPPSPPFIQKGGKLLYDQVLGPLQEGDPLRLSCSVAGGEPPPRVIWYKNDKIMDDAIESRSDSQIINYLVIKKLTREFHDSTLMCSASNNNVTSPATASVTVLMNLRPLSTRIVSPPKHFRNNAEHKVECVTIGSRPHPNITWSIEGGKSSIFLNSLIDNSVNKSISTVRFMADLKYHGFKLTCSSFNPLFPATELMDSVFINITYPPLVSLELGRGVSAIVREGEDVYFNCRVKSNPPTYKINWLHENEIVSHSPPKGIVITRHSLALRGVTRDQAGRYVCAASNVEGDSNSLPITLEVNYAPVCIPSSDTSSIFATGVGQPVNVTCDVDSSPKNVKYSWVFNNSVTSERVPDDQVHPIENGASLVSFVARSLQDYGTLQCWAENEIGKMEMPCLYNILPADRPDSPLNCSVSNKSYDSLAVNCSPGFDGGLGQIFSARVYEAIDGKSQLNVSSENPNFILKGLTPGLDYIITVVARNQLGESKPIQLEAFTYKMAENRMRDKNVNINIGDDRLEEDDALQSLSNGHNLAFALLGGFLLLVGALLVSFFLVRSFLIRRSDLNEEEESGGIGGSVVFLPPPDNSPTDKGEAIQLETVHGIINYIPAPPVGLSV